MFHAIRNSNEAKKTKQKTNKQQSFDSKSECFKFRKKRIRTRKAKNNAEQKLTQKLHEKSDLRPNTKALVFDMKLN